MIKPKNIFACLLLVIGATILTWSPNLVAGLIKQELAITKDVKVTTTGEKKLVELEKPLKFVTIIGSPELNDRFNAELWDDLSKLSLESEGPSRNPSNVNISSSEPGDLVTVNYALKSCTRLDESLPDAKVLAIATLMSNHIVHTLPTELPMEPVSQFRFSAERIIPALILNDLIKEKNRKDLKKLINWPTFRFYIGDAREDKKVIPEREFPVWEWPSLWEMFMTGRFMYREATLREYSELLKNEEPQYSQMVDHGLVPIPRTNVVYTPVSQKYKLLKGLLELVDLLEFKLRYNAKMIELSDLPRKLAEMRANPPKEDPTKKKDMTQYLRFREVKNIRVVSPDSVIANKQMDEHDEL